ncbi:photoreceptor disk component PRCD isoform X1 [Balaenoptera acutorostrata]|uniref:Photoreceptor disk component PRCD isoform X1 n=1 Tax=Balaenoptera acutorostrata TaxID=9767 RepID=A0A452CJF1_BALAC|nr:photoreceptor disk component PRCD isoform X1 [Balaenoptera acutorostrata]
MEQLWAAAWKQTSSPQAAHILVCPPPPKDAVAEGAAGGRLGKAAVEKTFRSCWETGLTDTRWLRWSQASPHDVPKPEERLLLLKTRKRSQTWQNCAADPFLKPFLAKGIAFCGRLIKMHSFGQGRGLPSSSAVCKTEEGQLQD